MQGIQHIQHQHSVEFENPELDFDNEIDVIEEDEENADEISDQSSKKVRKAVRKVHKKRRPSDKESLKSMNEDIDPQKLMRKRADRKNARDLTKIDQKVKTQLNRDLQAFIAAEKKAKKKPTILSDKIQISSTYATEETQKEEIKKIKQVKKKEQVQQLQALQAKQVPNNEHHLRNFISSYSDVLMKDSPEKKTKLKKAEEALLKNGITTRQVREIEKNTSKIIHTDLKKQLKKQYLRIALSFNDKMQAGLFYNYSTYYSLLETAKQANVFNADNKEIKKFQNQIKQEINYSLASELDRELVKIKLETGDVSKLVQAFEKYNAIAGLSKFKINDYLARLNKKMENEGLTPFLRPDKLGPIDNETDSQSDTNQQKQKDNEEILTEKEHLETNLRNLFIQSHFKASFFDQLKNKKEIKNCKKTISDKEYQDIDVSKIEAQAKKIASLRLMLSLRSLLETRAALPSLDTDEYKKVKSKIKETLQDLKKIGKFISAKELQELKHQCNRAMFSIIKEDYIKLKIHFENDPTNLGLEYQLKKLADNLKRLKEESAIIEKTDPKMMEDLHFLKDVNIVEAA